MISNRLRIGLAGGVLALLACHAVADTKKAEPVDASLVDRGKYLALAGDCMPCHTGAPKEAFAGGLALNTPFGKVYSPNITPDDETGIGKWTYDQFKRAVHDGIRADGAYLYPAMPYPDFTKIKADDLKALWAYMRSLKPIKKARKENGLSFPFNIRELMFFWRVLFFDEGYFQPDKSKSAEWNRGAYLVEALAHCSACHTPRNLMGATIPSELFEGTKIDTWYAPDITEKALKEVNKWDQAKLVEFFKGGKSDDSTPLGPMEVVVHESLSNLKDNDLKAIADFMLNDDTGAGDVVQPAKVAELTPKVEERAKKLYDANCSACHQKTGDGMKDKVPPLAGNPTVVASEPYNILSVVLEGIAARDGLLAMPSFAPMLSNQDVADIANYVRTTWGNKSAPDVTAGMVASWRSQVPPAASASPSADTKDAGATKTAADSSKDTSKAGATATKGADASTPAAAAAAPPTNPLPQKPYYIISNDIVGLVVRSQSDYAQELGTLDGLIIDSTSGQTLYAIVDRGGFLGFDRYKIVVPFQLVKFTGQWDNPTLAIDAFKVENAPRITEDSVEDLLADRDWRRSVAAYFGVALSQPKADAKTADAAKGTLDKTKDDAKKASAPKESAAEEAAERGKKIAQAQCSACHSFNKGGGTRVGPNLYGVYGTKIASKPGYSFSAALKKHDGEDWDAANLDKWLKSPSTFAPGTYMTFPGLPSQTDREDVIAYLKSL